MPTEVTRLDRHIGRLERGLRLGQRGVRNQRVFGAVNEKHRRARAQLARQQFGGEQPARKADDAGDRLGAPQPDEERHHRALREPDQRQIAVGEAAFGERLVDEGVEDRRGRPHPAQHRLAGCDPAS